MISDEKIRKEYKAKHGIDMTPECLASFKRFVVASEAQDSESYDEAHKKIIMTFEPEGLEADPVRFSRLMRRMREAKCK